MSYIFSYLKKTLLFTCYAFSTIGTAFSANLGGGSLTLGEISYNPLCPSHKCWNIDFFYTLRTSINDVIPVSVLFLPKAYSICGSHHHSHGHGHGPYPDPNNNNMYGTNGCNSDYDNIYSINNNYDSDFEDTFFPQHFPCGTADYNPSNPTSKSTSCCLLDFNSYYNMISSFDNWINPAIITPKCTLSNGSTILNTANTTNINGNITEMPSSSIISLGIVDTVNNIYKSRIILDESDLIKQASIFTPYIIDGTTPPTYLYPMSYTIDTFIGLASFSSTGTRVMDSSIEQINIKLMKTNYLTISSVGTNDITFLRYINARIHEVYDLTSTTKKAQYIQISLTIAPGYTPGVSGLVPLTSVAIGFGTNSTSAVRTQICDNILDIPVSSEFERIVNDQGCGQDDNTRMCYNQALNTVDNFIVFYIPINSDNVSRTNIVSSTNYLFINFVISVLNNNVPSATTINLMLSLKDTDIYKWCNQITSQTFLNNIVRTNILVGIADTQTQFNNMASYNNVGENNVGLVKNVIQTAKTSTVNSGLITIAVQGNSSYFNRPEVSKFKLFVEDIFTIHFMESNDVLYNQVIAKMADASQNAFTTILNGNVGTLKPSQSIINLCPSTYSTDNTRPFPPNKCIIRWDMQYGITKTSSVEITSTLNTQNFMKTIFGNNDYATQLGASYTTFINNTYNLNNRYNKVWLVNPGFNWLSGVNKNNYLLSQKILMVALIYLDDGTSTGRRRLLSVDTSGSTSYFNINNTAPPKEILMSSMGASITQVLSLNIKLLISYDDWMLPMDTLVPLIQTKLVNDFISIASPLDLFISLTKSADVDLPKTFVIVDSIIIFKRSSDDLYYFNAIDPFKIDANIVSLTTDGTSNINLRMSPPQVAAPSPTIRSAELDLTSSPSSSQTSSSATTNIVVAAVVPAVCLIFMFAAYMAYNKYNVNNANKKSMSSELVFKDEEFTAGMPINKCERIPTAGVYLAA